MNATTAALADLAKASSALERHTNPTPEDVAEALEAAKSAAKTLRAANDLLQDGIYEVSAPPDESVPLPFDSAVVVQRGRR